MQKFGAGAELRGRALLGRWALETAEVESAAASSDDCSLCSVTQLNEHLLRGELDLESVW